jgi:predicted nucleic acid-binding protein
MAINLAKRIPDGATVLVDTNPLVYLFEGNRLAAQFEPIFADIESGRIQGLITPITLAEIVSGPLQAGKEALAARYRQALTASFGWSLRELDADIAILSARLRLVHRLKLPDAIQLATAVHEGCAALVTHDRDFTGVTDLPIIGIERKA